MEWDDLRYVLAVHKAGSMAAAGHALQVSHITVFRRLEKIEKGLGVRVFDRRQKGCSATSAGLEVIAQAELVEAQINALERRVWQRDSLVRGTVRLTTTESIATTVLPGILLRLREKHPGLLVETVVSNRLLNITKRDADIAIRYGRTAPEALIGQRVARVRYAVYGWADIAPGDRQPDLAELPWAAREDSPEEARFTQWIRQNGHEPRVAYRANSFPALAAAIRGKVGVGILSCFLARSLGDLVQLTPPLDSLEWRYWVLTHPELRSVARVATVYAQIRESFQALRPLFEADC
jgi:DNA-binding transcriptional LysR family regulator